MHAEPLPVNHACLKLACRFFAVGDASDGSIKRVASGVAEESIAISFVHKVLQQ